ncbi:hypothetical protein AHAS_Ahas17G0147700 [Arachis hypogaea]
METGVLFYEVEHPFIYENPTFGSYYIYCREPCIRLYILRDRPFLHLLDSPDFDLDMSYDFSLSWLHPDAPGHPFSRPPIPAQPLNQAAPEPDVDKAYIPDPPSDVIIPPALQAPLSPIE